MDHGDHAGYNMGPRCSMNMLWCVTQLEPNPHLGSNFPFPRNTQVIDTCIVFPQWHIRSNASFVLSFFVIVALGVLYEYLREVQKDVDRKIAASLRGSGAERISRGASREGSTSPDRSGEVEDAGLLTGRRILKKTLGGGWVLFDIFLLGSMANNEYGLIICTFRTPVPFVARLIRAILYGASVFLSFFLMLVFMTYNVRRPFSSALAPSLTHSTYSLILQAYLIIAVVIGAALGHFIFGDTINVEGVLSGAAGGKGMACH
jgi:solute carrier family 31 (copper transporter), member 1